MQRSASPNPAVATSVATEDTLVCVDSHGKILGYKGKAECHDGLGILHKAFSVFLFDAQGRVLLQQRAAGKRLWPGFWANACCSHPRKDESLQAAVARRLQEELGVTTGVTELFTFEYWAQYQNQGSEHELCAVLAGRIEGEPAANPEEVAAWKYLSPDELDREIATHPERYSPWLQMEWKHLRTDYRSALAAAL